MVLEGDIRNSEIKVSFLHPRGPAHSYKYPTIPDILTVPLSSILTKVNPRTATGRTYTLTKKENQSANKQLTELWH